MRFSRKTIKAGLASRAGLTLVEVLIAMGIFMVGSVSIMALFTAGSILHADACNRRTASFIAEELLAEVRGMRFRDVYAKTTLTTDLGGDPLVDQTVDVMATSADIENQAANFDVFPVPDHKVTRNYGPLLIGAEWIWSGSTPTTIPPAQFTGCLRECWGTTAAAYTVPPPPDVIRVLQPRTWYYVLDDQDPGTPAWEPLSDTATTVIVAGNPEVNPVAPDQGYIVIDEEWMSYSARVQTALDKGTFTVKALGRGFGNTAAVEHKAGTPVTVAKEHPRYPGFWYTVQFYPVNATGSSAQVIVTVGYGNERRFRAHVFRSIYTPAAF